jgi:hypothetical protein
VEIPADSQIFDSFTLVYLTLRLNEDELISRMLLLSEDEGLNAASVSFCGGKSLACVKRFKHMALLLHPDKNSHPMAKEAFQKLKAAFDQIGAHAPHMGNKNNINKNYNG